MTVHQNRQLSRSSAWTAALLRSAQLAYLAFLLLSVALLASSLATGAGVRAVLGLAVQAALWAALLLAAPTEARR
ncbi:hypothetical protein [Streptomyces sp. NRRL S-340]|uniref:hypothetical protein n=1 Tax=Streptomyces sp. NRRL S-340 TaxID=1463901 RepID=UPI00055AD046|nr:hypothetical protein [Streptomyces sp. NRRL S-340]